MAYIITRLCRDCVDTGCVAVCPVDCIYEYSGSDTEKVPEPAVHPPRRVHRLRRVRARVPVAGHLRRGRRPRGLQGRHPAQLRHDGAHGRLQGRPEQEDRAPDGGAGGGQQGEVGLDGLIRLLGLRSHSTQQRADERVRHPAHGVTVAITRPAPASAISIFTSPPGALACAASRTSCTRRSVNLVRTASGMPSIGKACTTTRA